MGVHGLWKLLEPAGKAVALETLQNKILGVDVSIWLHQLMKGFQDSRGSPLPNAHLLGLFHRVCKLLFYRIKPVFVFDGGVPVLKKSTIAARRKQKGRAAKDAERVCEQLLKNLAKHKAVRKVLGEKASRNVVSDDRPRKDENLFQLPPMLNDFNDHETISSDSDASVKYEPSGEDSDSDKDVKYLSPSKAFAMNLDLHTLDVKSENFRSLPADVRHDILSDLKETRKQNSWGRLHEMPKESNEFSSFQLSRLLKRRTVQVSLEEAEKEMGGKVLSMAELQDLMNAQGVKLEDDSQALKETQLNAYSRRIASDVATRYLLVSESLKSAKPTDSSEDKAGTEEAKKELSKTKVKIKQEYEDNWSSDEEVKTVQKAEPSEIKIKQEPPDSSSSDDETRIAKAQSLVEQFVTEKDTLSQEEILAVIRNESKRAIHPNLIAPDAPSTSRDSVVALDTRKVAERSPEAVKSDSDNDFDEVLPAPPRRTGPEKTEKSSNLENKNFEVVIDKAGTYNPEDDIFADLFPVSKKQESVSEHMKPNSIEVVIDKSQNYKPGNVFLDHISKGTGQETKSAKSEAKKIEVVVESHNYKPEDDIFADVFSKNESPKAIDKLLIEIVKTDKNQVSENEEKECLKKDESISETEIVKLTAPQILPQKMSGESQFLKEDKDTAGTDMQPSTSAGEDDLSFLEAADDTFEEKEEEDKEKPDSANIAKNVPSMTSEELQSLETVLEERHERLLAERGRQERLAASITDQMCAEAQELLRLFGVPYVVAPMEAEAQCAFLDALSLTEGTITDDSDIWLFGGRKVYKNFFNQKKHVLQYTSTTIQHYLKLERHHMILLALLVGSDYTAGLQGIGPVTAMEVLAAFPPGKENAQENKDVLLEGLRRFRDWWQAGRPQRSARTQQLRNKVRDVQFYEGFPSTAVVEAYLRPAVDESREMFSWGDLDLQGLREFARMKFGWAQAKADEILLPVAKRVAERKNQRFIDSYFNAVPQFKEGEHKMSKRVKRAVRRMDNEEDVDDPEPISSPPKKRKTVQKKPVPRSRGMESEEDVDDPEPLSSLKKRRTVQKKFVPRTAEGMENEEDVDDPESINSPPKKQKTVQKKSVLRTGGMESEEDVDDPEPISSPTKKQKILQKTSVPNTGGRQPRRRTNDGGADGEIPDDGPEFETSETSAAADEPDEHGYPKSHLPPKPRRPYQRKFSSVGEDTENEESNQSKPKRKTSSAPRKTAAKRTKTDTSKDDTPVLKRTESLSDDPQDESCVEESLENRLDEGPKPRPRQRTSTGVVRRGAPGPPKKITPESSDDVPSVSSQNKAPKSIQPRRSSENKGLTARRTSLLGTISEEEENEAQSTKPSDSESRPSTSQDCEPGTSKMEDPDEEEEAILASLHAMDWDDDPWGGFQMPRERVFFGGVRKNPEPRVRRTPQPPPPPPVQEMDNRGYRPGTRTQERIQSRVTHPQFEVQFPDAHIPQREKDRQQAEESKMKAIKLFKAAGVMKTTKMLGEDPEHSRRRTRKKKTVAKVTELNLSEESSDD